MEMRDEKKKFDGTREKNEQNYESEYSSYDSENDGANNSVEQHK